MNSHLIQRFSIKIKLIVFARINKIFLFFFEYWNYIGKRNEKRNGKTGKRNGKTTTGRTNGNTTGTTIE
jgi:hypothetical protein